MELEYSEYPDQLLAEYKEAESRPYHNDLYTEMMDSILFQYGKYSREQMQDHKNYLKDRSLYKDHIKQVLKMTEEEKEDLFYSRERWVIAIQNMTAVLLSERDASDEEVKLRYKFAKFVITSYSENKLPYLDELKDAAFSAVINSLFEQNFAKIIKDPDYDYNIEDDDPIIKLAKLPPGYVFVDSVIPNTEFGISSAEETTTVSEFEDDTGEELTEDIRLCVRRLCKDFNEVNAI